MAPKAPPGRGVKVYVRIRPSTCIQQPHLRITDGGKAVVLNDKAYAFDGILDSRLPTDDAASTTSVSQEAVFDIVGQDLVEQAFSGYHATILAYGQTGSGKTYSIMGNESSSNSERGILPRLCEALFERINAGTRGDAQTSSGTDKTQIVVSFYEIYNETVRDLLADGPDKVLRVRESPVTGPYVERLSEYPMSSPSEMLALCQKGNKNREVAATAMNARSSRSHAVFCVHVRQTKYDAELDINNEISARINIVDLAGSERINVSGTEGLRRKEGANINNSLTTLGLVIKALAHRAKGSKVVGNKKTFVPYRDSILTWVLKHSLGGNAITTFLACISPDIAHVNETLATLRYASTARLVQNDPIVNEDASAKVVRELMSEIKHLRSLLNASAQTSFREQEMSPLTAISANTTSPVTPLTSVHARTPNGSSQNREVALLREKLRESESLLTELRLKYEEEKKRASSEHHAKDFSSHHYRSVEDVFSGDDTCSDPSSPASFLPAIRIEDQQHPHFICMNEDSFYDELVLFFIKRSSTIRIGSGADNDIMLSSPFVLEHHCVITCLDEDDLPVFLTPCCVEDAAIALSPSVEEEFSHIPKVFVNGRLVTSRTRLHHTDRVIFGHHHLYRVNHPIEKASQQLRTLDLPPLPPSTPLRGNHTRQSAPPTPYSPFQRSASISDRESLHDRSPSPEQKQIFMLQERVRELELALRTSDDNLIHTVRQLSEQIIHKQEEEETEVEQPMLELIAPRGSTALLSTLAHTSRLEVLAQPNSVTDVSSSLADDESIASSSGSATLSETEFVRTLSLVTHPDSLLAQITVFVPSAHLINPPNADSSFHVYIIHVTIGNSCWLVGRRFKEFYELYAREYAAFPRQLKSAFPSQKIFFSKSSRDSVVVDYRRHALGGFLRLYILWKGTRDSSALNQPPPPFKMSRSSDTWRDVVEKSIPFLALTNRDIWMKTELFN